MAEVTAKGICATFGLHGSDIHDLYRTAQELEEAYRETRWQEPERRRFASRIWELKSKGRAALRAEKWKRPFEPLCETIDRLGQTWLLPVDWLESVAKLHPECRRDVMDIARRLEDQIWGSDEDPRDQGSDADLMDYVRRTRQGLRQLESACDEEVRSGISPCPGP